MPNPALVVETALLILAAFLIGATLGALAKTAFLRVSRKTAASVVQIPPAVAEPPQVPALVAAPTIAPLSKPASPAAPLDIPVPDFASIVQSIARGPALASIPTLAPLPQVPSQELVAPVIAPVIAPARLAGQATSGRLVQTLRQPVTVAESSAPVAEAAEVIPFPQHQTDLPPQAPATRPEDGSGGPVEVPEVTQSGEPASLGHSELPVGEPETPEAPATAGTLPVTAVAVVVEVEAPPGAERRAGDDQDEAAAMRAIEGTLSLKRRSNRRKTAPSPIPDAADMDLVADVARDTRPVDGRPDGLTGPRNGVKDDLTNIIGILPIIETSLNSAGVYHFDQVADFTDENVAWLEGHLAIVGRVSREHWREQARELAAVSESALRMAGQP